MFDDVIPIDLLPKIRLKLNEAMVYFTFKKYIKMIVSKFKE